MIMVMKLINDDVMVEFNEIDCDGSERGMSVIDFYERFGYDSEGGKLIKKYGSEVIKKEYVERVKKWSEENGEEYYEVMWD
jgi:predicted enzyme involved in methoxymalonyl-ACP biosynthesis